MPRPRAVKRVVNALHSQARLIVHLECGHNMSIDAREAYTDEGHARLMQIEASRMMLCTECPDLPKQKNPLAEFHQWSEAPDATPAPTLPAPEDYAD